MIMVDDGFVRARALLDLAEAAAARGMQFGAILYLLRVVIEDLEMANLMGVQAGTLKPYELVAGHAVDKQ